ncbi:MAG: hypothetical protein J2O48_07175 [Solirubrobacterales bacterium]|nr:hypothetical protein [Solirubrobacterales bacterium]
MPIHLQTHAPLAERVLLPGDPGRALRLAKELLDEPKMFNHNRGLWGYSGTARADGRPLSIQSTGMGGPSAAIVVSELIDLGATELLRVGTCGALAPELELGQLLAVSEALCEDGTSRALGAARSVAADPEMLGRLSAPAARIVTTDLFYDAPDLSATGAQAVEMETAAIFTLARRRGVRAGAALLVTDLLGEGRVRISDHQLAGGELELGRLAVSAL